LAVPEISIITATYNRCDLLLKKLESLRQQTLSPERFEWILCINGSTDNTLKEFQNLQTPFHLKIIDFKTNQGISKGRNACVQEAQGAILYFSDDDCILQKDTLEKHLAVQQEACVAIGGIRFESETVSMWQPQKVDYWNLNGANSSLPKKAFKQAQGFDERLHGYGGEDLLLGYLLKRQGLVFEALDSYVTHVGPNPMQGQDLSKAKSAGKNARKISSFYPELAFRLGVHPQLIALKKLSLYGPIGYLWKHLHQDSFRYERAYLEGALEGNKHV
jgi:glycosyltransferase involved in cell wall biosynthesis